MAACSTNTSYLPHMNEHILLGHGEYVAFYEVGGKIDRDTFEKVYRIFNENSPAAIANSHTESVKAFCASRFDRILGAVKEVDPSLHIAFVPKTLYELVYIRKCIEEDVNAEGLCRYLDPSWWSPANQHSEKEHKEYRKARNCWHLCAFDFTRDCGDTKRSYKEYMECNDHRGAREIAFRLNQAIVDEFNPKKEGFTYHELCKHGDDEIRFLRMHKANHEKNMHTPAFWNGNGPGPASTFAFEVSKLSCYPLGIRDEDDAQLVRKAIELDCSDIAKKAFILYRGQYRLDTSLQSYGPSFFARCIYNAQHSPAHNIRNFIYSYAIPIPYEQLHDSPFEFAPTNAIVQLTPLLVQVGGNFNEKDGATNEQIEPYEKEAIVFKDIRDEERIRIYGTATMPKRKRKIKDGCTIA